MARVLILLLVSLKLRWTWIDIRDRNSDTCKEPYLLFSQLLLRLGSLSRNLFHNDGDFGWLNVFCIQHKKVGKLVLNGSYLFLQKFLNRVCLQIVEMHVFSVQPFKEACSLRHLKPRKLAERR